MTISTTTTRVAYEGDGVTTAFAVPFPFFAAAELEVIDRTESSGAETTLALGIDYTVTGGQGGTGTVSATAAPPAGSQWVIRRKTAKTQTTDYAPNDPFPAETHEKALDRLTMIAQELGEAADRAVKFPKTDAATLSATLPPSVDRATKVLAFDASGAPTVGTMTLAALEAGATDAAASATAAAASASAAATSATGASASATSAATSAAAAQAAAASVGFSDVVFLTVADSPYTITAAHSGKLFNVDTSGGAFTFNLPQISTLTLPFMVGIKKATSDANNVTVNRGGTDLFDSGASSKTIGSVFGTTLIPDKDPTPDKWTAADWAGASIAGNSITNGLLAQMPARTIKGNNTGATANASDIAAGQLPATNTNDAAASGSVGEYIEATASNTSATVTMTIASPCVVTWSAHGFSTTTPTPVFFTTTGALPTGLSANTTYWTIPSSVTPNTFQLASSISNAYAGTAINTSGSQSGTHTALNNNALTNGSALDCLGVQLTAGDWDVEAMGYFTFGASTTTTFQKIAVATSSNASVITPGKFQANSATMPTGPSDFGLTLSRVRFSLNATTIVYLNTRANFAASTAYGFGTMTARRVR
ncbi:MAG: hypothetical protein ACM30I_01870 [Gemmatimonas sp.]